jgi:AraC-like DNA-binding protein
MQLRFSTDDLPPGDRIGFWCDFLAQQVHSFTPCELPDAGTFRAEAHGHVGGGFALLDIQTGLERARRTAVDLAKDKTEAFYIRRWRRPVIWRAAPRSTPVDVMHEPGDFSISSTEWQWVAESRGAARFDMLVIPLAVLSPLLTGGRLVSPVRLPAGSPLGSLLSAAIDAANAQVPLLPNELGESVLRNLTGLVALACGASDEGQDQGRESLRAAKLARIKRHIAECLAEPDLTPASAAAALGISVRQLHLLFEPTGVTFTRYVLRQRLLKCHDAIAGAPGSGRSVADIAFGWGFNSMATFYRAFANDFGAAPTALRAAARRATAVERVEEIPETRHSRRPSAPPSPNWR